MFTQSRVFTRVLAWGLGGLVLLVFLGLHAAFLIEGAIEPARPEDWDWIFILVFVALAVLTFRSLVRKLQGVDRAGAVFRIFLGVSAALGFLSPVTMTLGLLRVSLRKPDAWLEPLLFMFLLLGGVLGAVFCFFARYFFRPHAVISPAPVAGAAREASRPPNLARPPAHSPRNPRKNDTYALLQTSLDQPLSPETLVEASRAISSICEADCARMSREAFGIVAANLSEADAHAFQQALNGQGIPTLLVRQDQVFPFPTGRVTHDLRWEGEGLVETDAFGRTLRLQPASCAFVAAGRIHDRVRKQETVEIRQKRMHSFGRSVPTVHIHKTQVKKDVWEPATYHRIDLILVQEPYRLSWQCDPTRPARLDNVVVRAGDGESIQVFMKKLSHWLPPQRLNLGLKKIAAGQTFFYPSRSAFEEEIVWELTRRREPLP